MLKKKDVFSSGHLFVLCLSDTLRHAPVAGVTDDNDDDGGGEATSDDERNGVGVVFSRHGAQIPGTLHRR